MIVGATRSRVSARSLLVAMALVTTSIGAPAHAAVVSAPIAVMPFKNVNQAKDLAWLEVGVAETMVSDLRRLGQKVVERDQLDLALTEIALQRDVGVGATDASTAARLGKMVGARTVVVGGFQRANKKVRITARFVNVQTGEITGTAKVTGRLSEIFRLQDEIVASLVGKKPPQRRRARRARKPKGAPGKSSKGDVAPKTIHKPNPEKTLEAYKAYSESLETTSPAKRVSLLRKAIALDPEFSYALDDLAKLESRLAVLRKRDATMRSKRAAAALKEVLDESLDWKVRRQRAIAVISAHLTGFHYRALVEDAKTLYNIDWPADEDFNVREYASFSIFTGHNGLKNFDLTLQAGERHLKEFPGGMYSAGVDTQLQSTISRHRRNEEARSQLPEKLTKIESEREKDLARAKKYARGDADKERKRANQINRNKDYRRCSTSRSAHHFEHTVLECRTYAERYAAEEERPEMVLQARWIIAQAHADDGDFEEARKIGESLAKDNPKWAAKMSVNVVLRTWPR